MKRPRGNAGAFSCPPSAGGRRGGSPVRRSRFLAALIPRFLSAVEVSDQAKEGSPDGIFALAVAHRCLWTSIANSLK